MRKLLRRGNFISQDDLKTRILLFIDYFNRTMAKPFKWTYKGKSALVPSSEDEKAKHSNSYNFN